jgi:hypothetical protein
MIKSHKDGEIVWIEISGEFIADELIAETGKWLKSHANEYVGYLVDVRQMTKQTAIEQKKAEEQTKKNKSGKYRAVLGKDAAMAALVNIYMRFTGAKGLHYFTNEAEARAWLMSKKGVPLD